MISDELADQEVAEQLQHRLRGLRCFQVFMRRLGPRDSVYVSALAWAADGNVVEAKAVADELGPALVQLFAALELAIDAHDRGSVGAFELAMPALAARALEFVKRVGVATVSALAAELDCTQVAASEILGALIASGELRRGPGGAMLSRSS